jgi:hypothetical protein
MNKKPTQSQVVYEMLLAKELVTASTVYRETKRRCETGSVNHHVLIRELKKHGVKVKGTWHYNESTKTRYKSFELVKQTKWNKFYNYFITKLKSK